MANEKRLIEANALKEHKVTGEIGNLSGDFIPGFVIDTAPTVDAMEVVHARWVDVREYCGDYMCSNCKELSRTKRYNYCPDCGAKMDGGNEDA